MDSKKLTDLVYSKMQNLDFSDVTFTPDKTAPDILDLLIIKKAVDKAPVEPLLDLKADPTGKTLIDIPERCAAANQWGADLYLDFHHNGGINGGSGGGVCAFSYPGSSEGKKYRNAIYEAVIAAGGLKGNRASPLIEKGFDSLRYSHMPAVLMEYGFMDSKTDAPVIITDAYSKLVAYATMEGIAKAAGLKKLPKVPDADVFYRVQVGAFNDPRRAEALAEKIRAAGLGEPLVLAVKR